MDKSAPEEGEKPAMKWAQNPPQVGFLFHFLMAVWQTPACWSLPSGCHCWARLDSSLHRPGLSRLKYVIKKACKKLVSLLHWPRRASWLENGRKYLSRPYCANHFKGRLPSEDWLKHTKGKHSTICSSQNILGLSEPESSCKCFPKAPCSGSSLHNSS